MRLGPNLFKQETVANLTSDQPSAIPPPNLEAGPHAAASPRRARSGTKYGVSYLASAGLGLLAVLLVVLDVQGLFRAIVVAAALLIVPGQALLPARGRVDVWAKTAVVVGISVTVETLLALMTLWSGLWHPVLTGCLLILVASVWIVLQEVLRIDFDTRKVARRVSTTASSQQTTSPRQTAVAREDDLKKIGKDVPAVLWQAVLDDGRRFELGVPILVGRNPTTSQGDSAVLIMIDDESKTVSKTHFALGLSEAGPFLQDLWSSNGTTVSDQTGEYVWCPPKQQVALHDQDIVSFGAHWLKIDRVGS